MTSQHQHRPPPPVIHADLPASLHAPRQARATIRQALTTWGLGALADDAELLASELVANAAEHADGTPIRFTIRQYPGPGSHRGILCQITDNAPARPPRQPGHTDSERGRGLQIVAALATTSGITAGRHGKTAWFTLTTQPERTISARCADFEAEPGP
jgi:serine/threonine-protein kinase RsbW